MSRKDGAAKPLGSNGHVNAWAGSCSTRRAPTSRPCDSRRSRRSARPRLSPRSPRSTSRSPPRFAFVRSLSCVRWCVSHQGRPSLGPNTTICGVTTVATNHHGSTSNRVRHQSRAPPKLLDAGAVADGSVEVSDDDVAHQDRLPSQLRVTVITPTVARSRRCCARPPRMSRRRRGTSSSRWATSRPPSRASSTSPRGASAFWRARSLASFFTRLPATRHRQVRHLDRRRVRRPGANRVRRRDARRARRDGEGDARAARDELDPARRRGTLRLHYIASHCIHDVHDS